MNGRRQVGQRRGAANGVSRSPLASPGTEAQAEQATAEEADRCWLGNGIGFACRGSENARIGKGGLRRTCPSGVGRLIQRGLHAYSQRLTGGCRVIDLI